MRIGIALVQQETNTLAVRPCSLEDFIVKRGEAILDMVAGTNTELGGAMLALQEAGATVVPLVYAWAMPAGRVDAPTFATLRSLLDGSLCEAGQLDGLILALHGSMTAEGCDDADGALLAAARGVVGAQLPIAISLDLHANVTRKMVDLADSISAYHTDPHVDMGDAGRRAADRAVTMARTAARPSIGFAKRPLLVPAETMNTTTGPLAAARRRAMATAPPGLIELGLFAVQPWLDVAEHGFAVVALTEGDEDVANSYAEAIAVDVWRHREDFVVARLADPREAIAAARRSRVRPFVIAESADAPTAGAAADSPVMVEALQQFGSDLTAIVPVVDPHAVARCHEAGLGTVVHTSVGASIDPRWRDPVAVTGEVVHIGEESYRLEGASFTGMEVSMGRYAVLACGALRLLISERAPWSSDPATFRHVGLHPEDTDVIVVRSCSDYRANYRHAVTDAVTLDVPGPATPRLENLEFTAAAKPPYPLAEWPELDG